MSDPLVVADTEIEPGTRASLRIPVARRYSANDVFLPAHVIHGKKPGPRLFVSAAIHGDEINGTEIIRRLLNMPICKRIRGALIAIPVVNVYGFVAQSRYLPDRRDLNRSFPGSPTGSLAARLANRFMTEVVEKSTHGIDLHTGAVHRSNLPQIRACLDDPETERLARAFGAPVILDATLREGSLRDAVYALDHPILLYEAGEALRFDEVSIRAGVRGVISVMRALDMLPSLKKPRDAKPFVARGSTWVRAPESGILRTSIALGAKVESGQRIATVSDPLGDADVEIQAPVSGVVIGRVNLPLVNEGDALFHIAVFKRLEPVAQQVEAFNEEMRPEPSDDVG